MKTAIAALTLLVSTSAAASLTLRYENKDSKAYAADAVCSGSKQDPVKFSASTTSSVSIQGSSPCKVTLKGTTITFDGDANIIIKDGKISRK
ncbi:hypothetical protein LXT21_33235 [Myxococcus sp. K38C18041901]|uniref:hypothetical protein n=1 Tax=Myxococcus guangdongensis TaxID=2906760 RepID=UPI0020A74601|nr:hypothetical protein [Myxococcus guangdongensis]MCP3063649.1 hypothetical protein [Myxococcus guangdongensis]